MAKPFLEAREEIADLENQLAHAVEKRDVASAPLLDALQGVVDAVKGDRAEGPNGELYGAMGYIRKSQRSTGLVRARKGTASIEGGSASWSVMSIGPAARAAGPFHDSRSRRTFIMKPPIYHIAWRNERWHLRRARARCSVASFAQKRRARFYAVIQPSAPIPRRIIVHGKNGRIQCQEKVG